MLGGARGQGQVFQKHRLVGYATLLQITAGVQLGGETFTETVIFDDEQALERFKRGRFKFVAGVSAVLVKAGAAATTHHDAARVYVFTEGGLLAQAAIGAQRFKFRPPVTTLGESETASSPGERSASLP